MEPERLFSFTWHPYAIDPNVNYSGEPATLVEFRLEPKGGGTLLTVTEAYRMNEAGWTEQLQNIERHVKRAA
jgi:Activator of Hsp90 ATPase homolog 1-like protein